MVGELVEAQITHDEQVVTHGVTHGTQPDVEDAVRIERTRTHGVLRLRHAEQHDACDAGVTRALRLRDERVERVLHDARHRRDRRVLRSVLAHEHRQDEVGRRDDRLGDHVAHHRRRAQPPRTVRQIVATHQAFTFRRAAPRRSLGRRTFSPDSAASWASDRP